MVTNVLYPNQNIQNETNTLRAAVLPALQQATILPQLNNPTTSSLQPTEATPPNQANHLNPEFFKPITLKFKSKSKFPDKFKEYFLLDEYLSYLKTKCKYS